VRDRGSPTGGRRRSCAARTFSGCSDWRALNLLLGTRLTAREKKDLVAFLRAL